MPLQACKLKRKKRTKNMVGTSSEVGWADHLNEKISFSALWLGVGFGFGGVVGVMAMWDKAKHWMVPPKT
jgi:hypothetical protein